MDDSRLHKLTTWLKYHYPTLLKTISLAAYLAFAGWLLLFSLRYENYITYGIAVVACVGLVALLLRFRRPFNKYSVTEQLITIGFTNHIGEAPELLRKYRDRERPQILVFEFRNPSIALSQWEKSQEILEAALNVSIIDISYHVDKRRVVIRTVPAKSSIPARLNWSDKLLTSDEFTLVLGQSALCPVTVDLTHIPHILLGGSTGSGKTALLRLLLMQALKKHASVIISDFKGGVDFPRIWHEHCTMCFDEQSLLEQLDFLAATLEERRGLLVDSECRNLEEYNSKSEFPLPRYILACDEVAEVLDNTGRSKEQKEVLSQIEARLSLIARQGRAFGIHLILSTQRPSADLIPGQIRTNLGFRVCGRADAILSQIILDNTAAEQIPKNARGRFMLSDGTTFQAYWFNEEDFEL